MTKQEFTSRVKSDALKNVDDKFYEQVIEPMYYMVDGSKEWFADNFDKAFGKLMGDLDMIEFLKELALYYKSSEAYEKKVTENMAATSAEIERLENALINNGHEDMVKLPKGELIRRKLMMGKELTEDQKQYICDNLH